MSDAETYLRELRRALPFGCRRRFLAEVREHFASAIAAEAERGVGRDEAERLTIERLAPAQALAEQLLADLRSGALGRAGRLAAALTITRVVAGVTVIALGIVAGALFAGKHSTPAPPVPERTARPTLRIYPGTGEVRAVIHAVQGATQKHQSSLTWVVTPTRFYLTPAPPKN
jgi:hypothetical protein